VVNVTREELPENLRSHLQVVVDSYLNIGEALTSERAEMAKAEAEKLVNVLIVHEQENMKLTPQVKNFYTNAAHVMRQSAENIVIAKEIGEIRSNYSAMAPAVYKLAKMTNYNNSLYYQYCAQSFDNRGAYWLSKAKEIKNPYAGQENKNCGKTVAIL
jgi:hypothetical protein